MPEKVQINLRAGADQKARWEAYIEESGRFATLSELIRASVEAEISQSETGQQTQSPALAGDIHELQEELSTVRKHVAWLRQHAQEDVDISDLAQAVFDELERLPDLEEPTSTPENFDTIEAHRQYVQAKAVVDPAEPANGEPQTAAALAERLDVTPQRIRDAIEYLDEQFLPVVAIEYKGEVHYFREE